MTAVAAARRRPRRRPRAFGQPAPPLTFPGSMRPRRATLAVWQERIRRPSIRRRRARQDAPAEEVVDRARGRGRGMAVAWAGCSEVASCSMSASASRGLSATQRNGSRRASCGDHGRPPCPGPGHPSIGAHRRRVGGGRGAALRLPGVTSCSISVPAASIFGPRRVPSRLRRPFRRRATPEYHGPRGLRALLRESRRRGLALDLAGGGHGRTRCFSGQLRRLPPRSSRTPSRFQLRFVVRRRR